MEAFVKLIIIISSLSIFMLIFVFITKILLLNFILWIKSNNPKKDTIYEFQKKITDMYGLFLDKKTNKTLILNLMDFNFKEERLYIYEPKNVLTGFGELGNLEIYQQFWKRVAHP